MKTILTPVDFSKESEKALQVSASIASKTSAKIVLVHMTDSNNTSLVSTPEDNMPKSAFDLKVAAKKFEMFLDKDYLKDILVEPLIKYHINFTDICTLAKDITADLIVMGSHGSNGLQEITTPRR